MTDQPDPPDQWRVYRADDTPDPEPDEAPASAARPPHERADERRTGVLGVFGLTLRVLTNWSPAGAVVGLILLGSAAAAVVAGVVATRDGVGFGGIDAQDPEVFEELVQKLDDERGNTDAFWVGLYTDYIIVDVPYSDDPADDREISYIWRGGDLEEWNKSTTTDAVFDLTTIDPRAIDGLCGTVLDLAEGATEDDCYVFIGRPAAGSDVWFRTSASDEFGRSYWVNFDEGGVEVERGHS